MSENRVSVMPGTRRAVLIGCATYGLRGCDADVALMAGTLRRFGFDPIEIRAGSDATRAGVLDAVDALVAATRPGDAALLYWSGHGGRVGRPDYAERVAAGRSPYYQFLVPFDLVPESSEFAGLLSEEVTAFQWRLTDAFLARGATPNVTTVLDCCHAGYLARDATLRPRALDEEQARSFPLAGIRARAVGVASPEDRYGARAGVDTNPYAVRLVAAQPEQSAFERDVAGATNGVFTAALVEVLDRLLEERGEADVPWSVIAEMVRVRVQTQVNGQRPSAEGPGSVLPFSLARARSDALPVTVGEGDPRIQGASLLGIRSGDLFELVSADGGTNLGAAEVERITSGVAVLHRREPGTLLPEGVRAVPRRLGALRRPVTVEVPGGSGHDLVARLTGSAWLVPAGPGDSRFASVVPTGAGLQVLDELGVPARGSGLPDDLGGRAAVVDLLEVMARGRGLTELASGEGDAALNDPVDLSFARVREGQRGELPRYGARVRAGERLYLRVHNLAERPLYWWAFDVGVSSRISLVTNAAPTGTRLGERGSVDDTRVLWGDDGAPVSWPPDVPVAPAGLPPERPETIVVVLADRPQDLASFVTARSVGERGVRGARSALELALAAVRSGTRELPSADEALVPLQYRVEHLSFYVVP